MLKLDFLIIGAQKSGTTSLREFLSASENNVYITKRELHFWNRAGQYREGAGLEEYEKNFISAQPHDIIGEKSPSYLNSFEAPERIHKHFPEIKLIAILRNPLERAYSAFWHGRRVGAIDSGTSFSRAIRSHQENKGKPYGDLVTPGLYSQHLSRYFQFFEANQILVLDFKTTISHTDTELRKVINFLELTEPPTQPATALSFPKRNSARASRFPKFSRFIHKSSFLNYRTKSKILKKNLKDFKYPEMEASDREYLEEVFAGEQEKLETLLGQRFDW